MFTTLSIIAVIGLGQISKKFIIPKYGNYGLYGFLFAVALVVNGIHAAMTFYPGFGALVVQAGQFLIASIGIYEILLNKIDTTGVDKDLSDVIGQTSA